MTMQSEAAYPDDRIEEGVTAQETFAAYLAAADAAKEAGDVAEVYVSFATGRLTLDKPEGPHKVAFSVSPAARPERADPTDDGWSRLADATNAISIRRWNRGHALRARMAEQSGRVNRAA